MTTVDRTAHHAWEDAAVKAMGVKHKPIIVTFSRLCDDDLRLTLVGKSNWTKAAGRAVGDRDLTEAAEVVFELLVSNGLLQLVSETAGERQTYRRYRLTVPQSTEDGDRDE